MSVTDVPSWVEGITYKNGWTFEVFKTDEHPEMNMGPVVFNTEGYTYTLRVTFLAPDVNDPTQTVTIKADYPVPDNQCVTQDVFGTWLLRTVVEVERHEVQEWLRIGGVPTMVPTEHRRA